MLMPFFVGELHESGILDVVMIYTMIPSIPCPVLKGMLPTLKSSTCYVYLSREFSGSCCITLWFQFRFYCAFCLISGCVCLLLVFVKQSRLSSLQSIPMMGVHLYLYLLVTCIFVCLHVHFIQVKLELTLREKSYLLSIFVVLFAPGCSDSILIVICI